MYLWCASPHLLGLQNTVSLILSIFAQLAQVHLCLQGHLEAAGVHQLQLHPQALEGKGGQVNKGPMLQEWGCFCSRDIRQIEDSSGMLLSVKLKAKRIANPFCLCLSRRQLKAGRLGTKQIKSWWLSWLEGMRLREEICWVPPKTTWHWREK